MKINTALILCAGYGKRLNPLTLDIPKPLLEINEVTLLENTINLLQDLGIKKIILNTFYLKEKIYEFIKKKKFQIDLEIIDEGEDILDTGGGILNMMNSSSETDFLTINPDTLWNKNYIKYIQDMEKFYFSQKIKNILLLVKQNLSFDKDLNSDFNLVKNRIKKEINNKFIYTGCQIINKSLFDDFLSKNFPVSEVWNKLMDIDQLYGYESLEYFKHITNIQVYNKLLKDK
jgi:N-acetyl-alpha-D-muramate 1-phosphate uridylyltransferase